MNQKKKQDLFARVHTRVTQEQKEFIKKEAEKESCTEGKLFRSMIDFYKKNNH